MKKYSIIVIGSGAGGLIVASGAARAGKRVLLIEQEELGGDCTHYACIPIAAARRGVRGADALKLTRETIAKMHPEALEKIDIHTLRGIASFTTPHTLTVVDPEGKSHKVKGRKIVIAAGSSPVIPSIPGLDTLPTYTNETIFSLKEPPKRLAILGGGPMGCELAQAFARIGSTVHLIHKQGALLPKEEPRAQELIAKTLLNEGVTLHFNSTITRITNGVVTLSKGSIPVDALLFAVGRAPNIANLNLKAARVCHCPTRIPTDRFARTNQKHIFAIGDIRGAPYFTHLAQNQAQAVLTSLLLPLFFLKKMSTQPLPRTTLTDPEIASCGLSEKEAHQLYKASSIKTYTLPFSNLDRAICEGRPEGFISIVTKKWSSRILGVTIAGPHAGEMLTTVTLAMEHGISLKKLKTLIFPYPTYNDAIRQAALIKKSSPHLGVE